MKTIRIGSGAGYGGDRIEPAIDLLENGNLDYLIFECLAERTIALANQEKARNPLKGYNHLFEYRFEKILDEFANGNRVRIVTNMGAANPREAAIKLVDMARTRGLNIKVAAVMGDDVLAELASESNTLILETQQPVSSLKDIISANAYIGCKGISEALANDAEIVITGRVSDPSLVLGILIHEFKWSMTDYDLLARGTMAGHLLECAGQITGGYFYDGIKKNVPDLYNLGFPIAIIDNDGAIEITKTDTSGGVVNAMTCKEQCLYEIQDPENYYTPDCIANIKDIRVDEVGPNRVKISNIYGKAPNGKYKVSIAYRDGYIGEGQISYGGYQAIARAQMAEEILTKRFELTAMNLNETRFDYIGINSLYRNTFDSHSTPNEVRLRVAGRTTDKNVAQRVGQEVEALYTNGPFGGGGVSQSVKEVVSIASILMDSHKVSDYVEYFESGEPNETL